MWALRQQKISGNAEKRQNNIKGWFSTNHPFSLSASPSNFFAANGIFIRWEFVTELLLFSLSPDFQTSTFLFCILCAIKTRRNKSLFRLSHEQTPLDIGASARCARGYRAIPCECAFWSNEWQAEKLKNNAKGWFLWAILFFCDKSVRLLVATVQLDQLK